MKRFKRIAGLVLVLAGLMLMGANCHKAKEPQQGLDLTDAVSWEPGAGTKVYHWPGKWRIGSNVVGNGRNVGSAHWAGTPTCVWQKYRGYADHD